MTEVSTIGLLGFGEVGQILASDLNVTASKQRVYDIKFDIEDTTILNAATEHDKVIQSPSSNDLSSQSNLIISAITAEQSLDAAVTASRSIQPGTWFLDLNSSSPAAKQKAAEAINHAGGKYIEASVMSPFPPKRLGTPILLGGPHAEAFMQIGEDIGLTNIKAYSETYGQTAAAKMCRSVMIKGMEALISESLISARAYGVEQTVLNSLGDLFPGIEWPEFAQYMIGRTLEHGGRRAEEMREVAKTVQDIGLTPHMALATVERQEWAKEYPHIQQIRALEDMLDALGETARRTREDI